MARDSENSAGDSEQQILEEWLLDYTYRRALEEFKEQGTVDGVFNRDFIQGLIDCACARKDYLSMKTFDRVNKLYVMCCLADGQFPDEDNEGNITSKLEMLYETSHDLETIFGEEMYASWLQNVKRQAVFSCCRVGSFNLAKDVFKRIWNTKCKVKDEVQEEVHRVVESNDNTHDKLSEHPYSQLIEQSIAIFDQLEPEPKYVCFLRQTVQRYQAKAGSSISGEQNDRMPDTTKDEEKDKKTLRTAGCQTDIVPSLQESINLTSEFSRLVAKSNRPELEGKPFRLPAKELNKFNRKLKEISKKTEDLLESMPSFDNLDEEKEESTKNTREHPNTWVKETRDQTTQLLPLPYTPRTTADKAVSPRPCNTTEKAVQCSTTNIAISPVPRRSTEKVVQSPAFSMAKKEVQSPTRITTKKTTQSPSSRSRKMFARTSPEARNAKENTSLARKLSEISKTTKRCLLPDTTTSPSTSNITRRRMKRRRMENEEEDADDPCSFSDDDDEDSDEMPALNVRLRFPPKVTARQSLAPGSQRKSVFFKKRLRNPWTLSEEEDLYQAVQECGIGNWAEVRVWQGLNSFPLRTNVNLKDKWRTMCNTGRINELAAKYGGTK